MNLQIYYRYIFISLVILLPIRNSRAFEDTISHPHISDRATESSKADAYLKKYLNIIYGIATNYKLNSQQITVKDWLKIGSTEEDSPSCRASNHFHDPLKAWGSSQVSDIPLPFSLYCYKEGYLPRYSAVTWATGYLTPAPDGEKASFPLVKPNNWDQARKYYYGALTYVLAKDREESFAKTFQAVGQVMHLLEDMAVPAHVRNDFTSHLNVYWFSNINPMVWPNNPFEFYVKSNPTIISKVSDATIVANKPAFGTKTVTAFWDTNQFTGQNPSDGLNIGLAEFTNSKYLSDATIPTNLISADHVFLLPAINNADYQICYDLRPIGDESLLLGKKRKYVSRKIKGGCPPITPDRAADHFAALSILSDIITDVSQDINMSFLSLKLDDNVHQTYAQELLPRAMGYPSALLEYFFRGDINLEPSTSDPSKFIIKNNSEESMKGRFLIYYDNSNNERNILDYYDAMTIDAHGKSMLITLDEPKDPSAYILIFKGKMGNEEGAVVGRVVKFSPLTISAPDRCLYGLADGARLPQQFNKIKAKVTSSFTPEQAVQSGTMWAVAKYKRRMDYQPDLSTDPPSPGVIDPVFAYSTSAPIPITAVDLAAMKNTKEFSFNFAGSPIPAGVTDLYLKVVFRGTTGTPQDLIAMGWKDLGEPMHHVYWNATDAFSIDGKMYDKKTIEASDLLLAKAKEAEAAGFPYFPIALDTEIAYCPNLDGVSKTHVEYKALEAGTFGRVITITEADQPEFDVFIHRKSTSFPEEMSSLFPTPTVINQTNQDGVLQIFPVHSFRGIASHAGSAFVNCTGKCPLNILTLPWPNPPVSMTPKPVTFIAQ